MSTPFRVGLTHEYRSLVGRHGLDGAGLGALGSAPDLTWEFMSTEDGALPPDVAARYDAIVIADQPVTASLVAGATRLRLVARFGVGYDNVDVDACTAAGILVSITPDGVRRPVATAAVTMMLALLHRVREKDLQVRTGRWAERLDSVGFGPYGRVLGIIGLGNIGREVARLCTALEMQCVAADPNVSAADAAAAGVRLTTVDGLLTESDVVVVTCALTPQTRGLLDAARIARMKPTAYLVNVARGAVVDIPALTLALTERRIAGAALDVFDPEPFPAGHPILALDNVLVSPHGITWTDQLIRGNGTSAAHAVLEVAAGRVPPYVLNPAAATTRVADPSATAAHR